MIMNDIVGEKEDDNKVGMEKADDYTNFQKRVLL